MNHDVGQCLEKEKQIFLFYNAKAYFQQQTYQTNNKTQ